MDKDELKIASLVAAFDAEHQRVQGLISQLEATSGQLKAAVADAAHKSVTEALVKVKAQAESAAATMRQVQRFHLWRAALQHFLVALAAIVVTLAAVWWYVPSPSEMTALRAEREDLQASIEDLTQRGAKMKIIGCGPKKRLCVLVDRAAGTYGVAGNKDDVYMIVKGY